MFEDSSQRRRHLKRMRNTNRRRMAHLKFEQEKSQLESVLGQQMQIYQSNMNAAMADNFISPQESEVLAGNLNTINQLMAQIQALQGQQAQPQVQQAPVTPESLGIDRHRIMGIPVGPKLTLDSPQPQTPSSESQNVLNLQPQGTKDQQVLEEAQALEQAAESL